MLANMRDVSDIACRTIQVRTSTPTTQYLHP